MRSRLFPAVTLALCAMMTSSMLRPLHARSAEPTSLEGLQGTEWVLRLVAEGERVPDAPMITLRFEPGRLSGSSGCNTYSGGVREGEPPTELVVERVMATQRACAQDVMALERRFLDAIQGATGWALVGARLVIDYNVVDQPGSLVFVRRERPEHR